MQVQAECEVCSARTDKVSTHQVAVGGCLAQETEGAGRRGRDKADIYTEASVQESSETFQRIQTKNEVASAEHASKVTEYSHMASEDEMQVQAECKADDGCWHQRSLTCSERISETKTRGDGRTGGGKPDREKHDMLEK